jgi:hypothetical protein
MDKKRGVKWVIIGLLVVVIGGVVVKSNYKLTDNDFRMAVVDENGLTLRSVSVQRKMVNELVIDKGVEVWIPNGMGWYQSDKIKRILDQEKKQNLASDIFFYNFGFIPDIVIFNNNGGWETNWQVIKKWGWMNYLQYRMIGSKIMIKKESVKEDLIKSNDYLNEIIPRDLADSRLLREDLRISVYNLGQSDGLASFMSRILEWSGFTVVGIDNLPENVDICLISYGEETENTFGFKTLIDKFNMCKIEKNMSLGKGEMELYFGDKYSQMLNYQSYLQAKQ